MRWIKDSDRGMPNLLIEEIAPYSFTLSRSQSPTYTTQVGKYIHVCSNFITESPVHHSITFVLIKNKTTNQICCIDLNSWSISESFVTKLHVSKR
jgi:hypothetical protein